MDARREGGGGGGVEGWREATRWINDPRDLHGKLGWDGQAEKKWLVCGHWG